jgi:hypothetical protein
VVAASYYGRVARLTGTGLDASFGSAGVASVTVGVRGLTTQCDHKILVGSTTGFFARVERLTATGALDASYNGPSATNQFPMVTVTRLANDVSTQKLYLAGWLSSAGQTGFAAGRILP